jgi:NodT family efflux transporter outer membrane factor (OMF) lipoprotein
MNRAFIIVSMLVLSSCNLAPPYQRPPSPGAPVYKEAGPWLPARPTQAELDCGPWWEMYADPDLNALEVQVEVSNQNLQAALARYETALAAVQVARADYFPTIIGAANPGAVQTSANTANPQTNRRYTDYSFGANLMYQLDVWGRVRNAVVSAGSLARASAADLSAMRLSLHAQLAQDYFSLRGDDAQQQILDKTVRNDEQLLYLVRQRYQGDTASLVDVAQAENQLETARTLAADMRLHRAQLEHAIAILMGRVPADFSLPVALPHAAIVTMTPLFPATLLERRPDISAAEQRVQSANAEIGVTRAAFFPAVTLSGGIGLESQHLSHLFKANSLIWALGPLGTATIINTGSTPLLTQILFDGGKILGLAEEAQSRYREAVANYRQTVLTAFQEVEDSLVALHRLDQERQTQAAANRAARLSVSQAVDRYEGGITTYLEVVVTQNTALQTDLATVNVNTRRQLASVQLIQALGGGWDGNH